MPEKSTNTQHRVTPGTEAQANHEVDASTVQDWKPGLQPSRTTGPAAANRSANSQAILPSEKGSTKHPKLDYPVWHKPYAEAVLETDPEILMELVAATERAVFERLLELTAEKDVSDEIQDIRRAIDVLLTLKAGKIHAAFRLTSHYAEPDSSTKRATRVLRHNGKIEYRGLA
jgi:hypothetical protein